MLTNSGEGRWALRPTPRVVEFSGDDIYHRAAEIFHRLSENAEIILVRKLPEVLHLQELLLGYIRNHCSNEMALRVKGSLFERRTAPDADMVAAYVAAARHVRDTLAVPALFSRLVRSFNLPQPVNIDCGHFRLMLPDRLIDRMDLQRDRSRRDDWEYAPPFNGTEPIIARGSAMPHRDISYPYYAFQINFWFPLLTLDETETLLFFPDAYYDYKQRVERCTGRASEGFVDDKVKLDSFILATPNSSDWGFGQPTSRAMEPGDVWIFYSQQVHGSPVRRPESLRLKLGSEIVDLVKNSNPPRSTSS